MQPRTALPSRFAPEGQHETLPRVVTFLKVLGHAGRLEFCAT